jgi:hypothetical protein
MELSMRTRHEIIANVFKRYREASKGQKGPILDEFVATTDYSRKYVAWILGHWGKSITTRIASKLIKFVTGTQCHVPCPGRLVVFP